MKNRILSLTLVAVLFAAWIPYAVYTAAANAADPAVIVGRIAIYPNAPKVGERADISVFLLNTGTAPVTLADFSAALTVNGTARRTSAFTGTLAPCGVAELTYTGHTVTEGSNIFTATAGTHTLRFEYNTRGAHLGYIEYEAEDGHTNGQVLARLSSGATAGPAKRAAEKPSCSTSAASSCNGWPPKMPTP